MTYIVNEDCIRSKHIDCVEVCPVDCCYEGEIMLVINRDECIDCGVCEPECPASAIQPETDDVHKWVTINAQYATIWPNITVKKPAPDDADHWALVKGMFDSAFSPEPGVAS
jgi:ferredoxin